MVYLTTVCLLGSHFFFFVSECRTLEEDEKVDLLGPDEGYVGPKWVPQEVPPIATGATQLLAVAAGLEEEVSILEPEPDHWFSSDNYAWTTNAWYIFLIEQKFNLLGEIKMRIMRFE